LWKLCLTLSTRYRPAKLWKLCLTLSAATATVRAEPGTGDAPREKKIVGLALVGAGLGGLAAGFYFGAHAKSESDRVTTGGGVWDPALEAAGKRDETRAEALWTLGGAAVAVGGVIFAVGLLHDEPPKLGIVPRGDGALVVWRCAL
jgi:hypothetical protein